MDSSILNKVSTIGHKYQPEGFIILGVFGSVARGDERENSDVDILYRCDSTLSKNHPGLRFFALYEQVKADLHEPKGTFLKT